MQGLEEKKYADAVLLLQTLVDSYPDSKYVIRAKLALDECSRQRQVRSHSSAA
jgi:outer membrane protein assembly factor BamD (BamD/ComL family)